MGRVYNVTLDHLRSFSLNIFNHFETLKLKKLQSTIDDDDLEKAFIKCDTIYHPIPHSVELFKRPLKTHRKSYIIEQ